MALFDFTQKVTESVDDLDSLLEGYTDEYLMSVMEASSKEEGKGKLAQLKQKASTALQKAAAPAHLKDKDWDPATTQKEMMGRIEKGDKNYIKSVLDATKPGSETYKADGELMKAYAGLFPYNGKKIMAQLTWFRGPFRKAAQKKAKELGIVVESVSLLEEAVVALLESDDDIKDIFLTDKDAVVIGAEDDKDVEKFIDAIPEDIEDEDLDDLVEAFVNDVEDFDDDEDFNDDDED